MENIAQKVTQPPHLRNRPLSNCTVLLLLSILRGLRSTEDPTTPVGAYDPGPEADWLESPYSQSASQFQKRVGLPLPSPLGARQSIHLLTGPVTIHGVPGHSAWWVVCRGEPRVSAIGHRRGRAAWGHLVVRVLPRSEDRSGVQVGGGYGSGDRRLSRLWGLRMGNLPAGQSVR